MKKFIECVPNISEGRNRAVVEKIAAAAEAAGGRVLNIYSGAATNRSVITFVAALEEAEEAAVAFIKEAITQIDMRTHKGAHPRIGAVDVFPYIPLGEATMAECVALARSVGARVARELGIPIYLYEEAAFHRERSSLPYLRKGEYEGIKERIISRTPLPDFGELAIDSKSGATIMGARNFLVAWNISLATPSKALAHSLAKALRESGDIENGSSGGMFKRLRAIGWYLEEFGHAQISCNVLDFEQAPLAKIYEAAALLAKEHGTEVIGSELVGMIPLRALYAAGLHYYERERKTPGSANDILQKAVTMLRLDHHHPFEISARVLELSMEPER